MTNANIPAGWYADPQGTPDRLRWWDGSRWTEHTHEGRPAQAQTSAPQQAAQQQQAQQPSYVKAGQQSAPQQQGGQPYGQQGPGQGYAPQQQGAGQPMPQQYAPQAGQQVPAGQQAGAGRPVHNGQVQYQVQQQAGVAPTAQGGGTLFTEPVLVVNQKAKLIEVTNEYSVFDQHGNTLGTVVQVGQSTAKKVLRFVSSLDQYMTHRLEIRDTYGQPQLVLTRPAKFIKSKVLVERPDGQPVGEIVQQNAIGKINFAMMAGGQQIGAIKAENWRAWNFAIVDHTDTEVARITKTWEGLAKTMFTTADNYVLQVHVQLPEPLRSLVVATALTVDTALKQDARGFG
ncbi:phospholipid scramblase-related protein [Streptomyces paromomycinus]|uniref:Scramblase n=1 Tax=Streptomyces paromomycinus TaxID=92743 RepID=A0A401VVL2_STREY|nr:phospholipid scramblase-related protein [Streptomyces paromomycinus]GCD41099.1 scramblase [Streptomyces paromomycinus]